MYLSSVVRDLSVTFCEVCSPAQRITPSGSALCVCAQSFAKWHQAGKSGCHLGLTEWASLWLSHPEACGVEGGELRANPWKEGRGASPHCHTTRAQFRAIKSTAFFLDCGRKAEQPTLTQSGNQTHSLWGCTACHWVTHNPTQQELNHCNLTLQVRFQ